MRLPLPTSAAASLAAHALLIAAAILATADPAHPRAGPERFTPIPFFSSTPQIPTPSRPLHGGGAGGPTSSHGSGLPTPPPTVDVPGPGPVDKRCYFDCLQLDTSWSTGTHGDRPGHQPDQPETADAVDVAASALPGTPPPAYPPMMRDAGIGAHLTVQFTVDTTGHAGSPTILTADVNGAALDAFLSAIRTSLAHTRFRPAMIGTHRVPQRVQQEFEFVPLR